MAARGFLKWSIRQVSGFPAVFRPAFLMRRANAEKRDSVTLM
ncbi:hypothetical protein [Sphingobium boeckii]|uniref:Uncharacterized protein n=1 Tax=Sphingobium boeckii TaxID=1082345 RepID=A0A7W9ECU9_9SPHN|nr:hypothetical protein [Sphingobium boeckii]MBB5684274.1 hypothetical protein [Sphingobium boeckii]